MSEEGKRRHKHQWLTLRALGGAVKIQRLLVPIRPHVRAELFVPRPMTEADWDQLMAVLAAMKPGLVREPDLIPVPAVPPFNPAPLDEAHGVRRWKKIDPCMYRLC